MGLFMLVMAGGADAQELREPSRVWAGAGLAGGGSSEVGGLGVMLQIVYQKQPHHVALRGVYLHDLSGFPDSGGGDIIAEAGLLYGRTNAMKWGHVAFAAGASAVAFDTCPNDDDTCFTVGVPLAAEAALTGKVVGLGLQVFGNVNTKAPYAGVSLFLLLGWLP